jgi:hypothetical protein
MPSAPDGGEHLLTRPKIMSSTRKETIRMTEQGVTLATKEYESQQSQLIGLFREISKAAEKGPSVFLMSMGGFLQLCALLAKFKAGGFSIQVAEFVSLIIAGTLLIAGGALIRIYQFNSTKAIVQERQKLGGEIVTGMITTSDKLLTSPLPEPRM